MVPDRVVGVVCLAVAVVAATWGDGPAGRPASSVQAMATAGGDAGEAADPVDPASTTSSTTAPEPPPGDSASTTSSTAADGDADPTTTAAPPPTTNAEAVPDADPEADAAAARRALLGAADLPSGFTQSRPPPPTTDSEGPFERCLGADAARLTAAVRAKAASAEFVRADTGTVSASVAVFDQAASAGEVISVLGTAPARSCFEGLINARLARNPRLSEDVRGSIGPLEPGSFGDQTTAFRFEVNLPAEDVEADPPEGEEKIPFIADFVFVRAGRVLVLFEFGNLRQPFPPAVLRAIVTNVVEHADEP